MCLIIVFTRSPSEGGTVNPDRQGTVEFVYGTSGQYITTKSKTEMGTHIRKAIVFCTNPLPGCFRFGDYFQMYPWASKSAPTSDKAKLHPVALEYTFDDAEQLAVPKELEKLQSYISRETHSNNKQKQILHLISSITNYRFLYPTPDFSWFVPLPNGDLKKEEIDSQPSQFGISLFTYPDLGKEQVITEFTQIEPFKFERLAHTDYYSNLDLDGKEVVRLPESIEATIENYLNLDDDSAKAINSATSLICQGIDLRIPMKSLSFVSFVSSIETMVDHEHRNDKKIVFECDQCKAIKDSPFTCNKCGRPTWGIAAKFRAYLEKYVSADPNAKAKINRIYSTRSKIVHAGLLMLGDTYIDWSNENKSQEEWQSHLDVMQTARLSVVNWLLMNK